MPEGFVERPGALAGPDDGGRDGRKFAPSRDALPKRNAAVEVCADRA
jgi:hypothetical protein